MQDLSPLVFIFAGGIVIAIVVFAFKMQRLKSRAQVMASFAAQNGFRSEGDVNPFLATMGLPAGTRTNPDTFRNVHRGPTAAGEALLYDHRPLQRQADSDGVGPLSTVVAFPVDGIPMFQMIRQGRFKFGLKDIDFPSHPVFSRRFLLMSEDEAAVRKLFSPAVLDACETLSEKRNWSINSGLGWLFVTFGKANEMEMRELIDQGARVAAAMKSSPPPSF
jgi:hypothetical protein